MAGMGDIRLKDEERKIPQKDIKPIVKEAQKKSNVILNKKEEKQTVKTMQDPKKVEKAVDKAEKGKGSVSDNFTAALMHFVPLVAGTALFGEDVGVSAQEGVNTALEAQRKAGLEERKVAAEEQRAEPSQMTEFQRQSLALREQQLNLEKGAESRRTKGLELNLDKFGLTKDQAAQLSEQQTKSFGDIEAVTRGLERITALKGGVNTGPVASRGQSALELVGQASPEFTELKAETEANVAAYIKAISGAQASDLEVQRLKRVAPTITDDDETFNNKLNAYSKIIEASKKSLAKAIATGQPLKKGTIDDIIDEFSGKEAGTEETPRQRLARLKAKHGR